MSISGGRRNARWTCKPATRMLLGSWTPTSTVHYNAAMRIHKMRRRLNLGILVLTVFSIQTLMIHPDEAWAQADAHDPGVPDLTSLNVRLSHRTIHTPRHFVKEIVALPHVHAARSKIAPSPKPPFWKTITITASSSCRLWKTGPCKPRYSLTWIFAATIPFVTACAEHRRCAYDRRPMTGGLGCVAICIQQALDPTVTHETP